MNKNRNIIISIFCLILILNFISNYRIRRELTSLEEKILRLNSDMRSESRNLENYLRNEYGMMEELIKKGQSLFAQTSIDLNLKGNKIIATMKGIPKEIANDEKLIAIITTDDKVYEKEADKNNTAVFEMEITNVIKPSFIIESGKGFKKENFEEIYTANKFSKETYCEWDFEEEDKYILEFWIVDEGNIPFLEKEDIEKAEFIMTYTETDMGPNEASASASSRAVSIDSNSNQKALETFIDDLKGISIPAEFISGDMGREKYSSKYALGYYGDFSEYADKENGNIYEIYFRLTTKDGIKYVTSYNPIATFRTMVNGGSTSCGNEILVPVLK